MNTNVIKINSDGCVEADNSHCSSCIYGYSIDKENKYYGCHISHDSIVRLNTSKYPSGSGKVFVLVNDYN